MKACPALTMTRYTIRLNRATFFYYNAIIIPGIVFAVLSFGAFFMNHQVAGERVGYGVTLILAVEVSKVVISTMIPVCGLRLCPVQPRQPSPTPSTQAAYHTRTR